ncbi:MAG: hypothetical protein CMI74_07520 [Candidatus Pelagibacter sp.]|nr:hypothetical protein [Candidatus Pelagibacter sp.]
MALLGNFNYQEWSVILQSGKDQWTEIVYAPDSEHAAWSALELSTNRKAYLKDVKRTHEW